MSNLTIISGNTKQTPIEIALGIDENGMTTAKKLYEFLGMDNSHYSRWCKNNITENVFAEENVDYWAFAPNGERDFNPNPTTDYRLTAKFAKKLSMMQKNERGEQAREYFTKVEDMAVDMANTMNSTLITELHTLKKELLELRSGFIALQSSSNGNSVEMTMSDINKIKSAVAAKVVEVLGGKNSNAYKDNTLMRRVFTSIYSTTNRKMGVRTYRQIRHNQAERYIQLINEYDIPVDILCDVLVINEEI